jgi:hypothetical protein
MVNKKMAKKILGSSQTHGVIDIQGNVPANATLDPKIGSTEPIGPIEPRIGQVTEQVIVTHKPDLDLEAIWQQTPNIPVTLDTTAQLKVLSGKCDMKIPRGEDRHVLTRSQEPAKGIRTLHNRKQGRPPDHEETKILPSQGQTFGKWLKELNCLQYKGTLDDQCQRWRNWCQSLMLYPALPIFPGGTLYPPKARNWNVSEPKNRHEKPPHDSKLKMGATTRLQRNQSIPHLIDEPLFSTFFLEGGGSIGTQNQILKGQIDGRD